MIGALTMKFIDFEAGGGGAGAIHGKGNFRAFLAFFLISLAVCACGGGSGGGSGGDGSPPGDPGGINPPPQAKARCGVYDSRAALEAIAQEAAQVPGFVPIHSPLPWVHFDGERFRLDDDREFVVRGLDYAYDTVGYSDLEFPLEEADYARMAAWGVTALRVRLRDTRSGWYPFTAPEPGYLEGLDAIVERAGAHGIYVIIATNGVEQLLRLDNRPNDPLYEQAKFRVGTRANDHWMRYMASTFARYRNTSTVLGFDAINEDYAFPPDVHDAECMLPAHEALLIMLREIDQHHVYFQEPAGWVYDNSQLASLGHPLPDDNRVFCTKWFATGTGQDARMQKMLEWAAQAGTPLFLCEAWVWDILTQPRNIMLHQQRTALGLLDTHTIGWITNGYIPLIGLLQRDGSPIYLADEWIRPYPKVIAGEVEAIDYDFPTRTLALDLQLSGSGTSEIYVPAAHTYGTGVKVSSGGSTLVIGPDQTVTQQTGTGLSWDAGTQTVSFSGETGAQQVVVASTDVNPGPVAVGDARQDYVADDFPSENAVIRPVYTAAEGTATLRNRMLESGDFLDTEVDCVLSNWTDTLSGIEYEIIARAALLQVDMRQRFSQGVADCLPP